MKLRLVFIFSLFAVAFYLLWLNVQPAQNKDLVKEPVLVPDFTATLLHQELFDNKGKLKQEVFSQKMEHYAELELTYFDQPEFIIYQNDAPFWRLSAKNGSVQDGLLTLDNDVTMYQLNDNKLVTTIETQYLEINLTSQIVWTDKPIMIQGQQTTITGKGMKADLNSGKVSLVNHATTIIKGN